jgi:integrase/recombinase XerD
MVYFPVNTNTYAIKLRLTYDRNQKYYPTGKYLSIDDWVKMHDDKNRNRELKDLRFFLDTVEKKAIQILDEMPSFSFVEFADLFNTKPKSKLLVLDALEKRHKLLKDKSRLSTAISYQYTIKSITEYLKSIKRANLHFSQVTPQWLEGFEQWMTNKGRSITTVGIYLRNLRTILNEAIEDGLLSREMYPFSKRKYQIPSAKNIKKALTIDEIKQFFRYVPVSEAEEKAKDLWLFSYLCNGLNVKDIARLKYKDMDSTHISFVRAKTERSTKTNQKKISIIRLPEVNAIIHKWGSDDSSPENYVFGILEIKDTPQQEFDKIKQAVKTINKYTKRIGEVLGFNLALTTYTARHSFATVLKRSGAPVEFISESLGHHDLRTTESYLDSFQDDVKESYQKKLLNFDND